MNPTSIESHLVLVLVEWVVILLLARGFGRLALALGQPLAVGEITAGLLLGPSVLGALWPEAMQFLFPDSTQKSLQILAKVGLILLLFQVGMEFDYGHLRTRSRTVGLVSLMGLLAPAAAGLLIAPWLHRTFSPELPFLGFQIFVCIALTISALPIMGRILIEMGLEHTPLGAMAISSAAIDDVVGWIFLAAGTALVQSGFSPGRLGLQVAGLVGLFLLLQRVVGPLLRRMWQAGQVEGQPPLLHKSYLAVLLAGLFLSCVAASLLGVFSLFGAFLFGVALHQQRDLVQAWRERFSDFVLVALVPIFFTNTGLRTEIGALTTPLAWWGAMVVMVAAVGGKLGGCYLGARLSGQPGREAFGIAALMNTRALMGLVAINVAMELGLLTPVLFTMFVLMALVTTAMTVPLLRRSLCPIPSAESSAGQKA
jgi:Kef-type K+ transport system membrane component KefB